MKWLFAFLMLLAVSQASRVARADWTAVSGFSMPESAIDFHNYSIRPGSFLPESLQTAHCTSLALFARQMFLHAVFIPGVPRMPMEVYRALLTVIYGRSTTRGPSADEDRIPILGYANLYEFTGDEDVEAVIKDVLGDSLNDAFRPNWNWSLSDTLLASLSKTVRAYQEKRLRGMIDRDRPALVYLTDGTKTAHAVLLYAYDNQDDRVVYRAYDSNEYGSPVELTFWKADAKMEHPDLGKRDPWVLHPY